MTRRTNAGPVSRGAAWLPPTDLPLRGPRPAERRRAYSGGGGERQTKPLSSPLRSNGEVARRLLRRDGGGSSSGPPTPHEENQSPQPDRPSLEPPRFERPESPCPPAIAFGAHHAPPVRDQNGSFHPPRPQASPMHSRSPKYMARLDADDEIARPSAGFSTPSIAGPRAASGRCASPARVHSFLRPPPPRPLRLVGAADDPPPHSLREQGGEQEKAAPVSRRGFKSLRCVGLSPRPSPPGRIPVRPAWRGRRSKRRRVGGRVLRPRSRPNRRSWRTGRR